jgi:hypothetical protein
MSLFKVPPEKIKCIFIVSRRREDSFLSFIFNLGYSWVERDFDDLACKLEDYGILLLRNDDNRLQRVFDKFYESIGITYYFVDSEHLLTSNNIDIFVHNAFVSSKQWKEFLHCFKNQNGVDFNNILKEIK